MHCVNSLTSNINILCYSFRRRLLMNVDHNFIYLTITNKCWHTACQAIMGIILRRFFTITKLLFRVRCDLSLCWSENNFVKDWFKSLVYSRKSMDQLIHCLPKECINPLIKMNAFTMQMSGSRMKVAGRFKPCVHMGCFDLEVFVEMNMRSRKASI